MMHIGVSLSPFGHHPAAWRQSGGMHRALGVGNFARQAQKAQDGALDFVFLADAQAQRPQTELPPQTVPFEPTTLVAALATLARQIGFVATAATGQHELYNLARRFASLDLISQGRVGWNLVASGPTTAWNTEYVAVVSALWDSWDDGAFVYDKTAGRFFMPEKMHVLDHRGEHFTVRGPLNVNPSPQGKPIIAQALTVETIAMAARSAEVMFVTAASREEGAARVAEVRRLLDMQGRKRSDVRALANIIPWIGATRAEALDRFEELNALSLPGSAQTPQGRDVIGTASDIADALQDSFERDEFDGFTILPPVAPGELDAFVDFVVPELRRRGLLRARYEGTTLRDHLGLDRSRRPATT
ncbi:MAG: LLM class flavin-dependent oxidoreductase [Steroidobacteraceae bacterium]|jgi:alkanesulfonate monooxygenase SsuD/methylene tetrahydromethanopterin reductase-like flavin-dependent oxidoreductase (luciferase family)